MAPEFGRSGVEYLQQIILRKRKMPLILIAKQFPVGLQCLVGEKQRLAIPFVMLEYIPQVVYDGDVDSILRTENLSLHFCNFEYVTDSLPPAQRDWTERRCSSIPLGWHSWPTV
jgi:hypothetical protein